MPYVSMLPHRSEQYDSLDKCHVNNDCVIIMCAEQSENILQTSCDMPMSVKSWLYMIPVLFNLFTQILQLEKNMTLKTQSRNSKRKYINRFVITIVYSLQLRAQL